jgi:Zn-dependent protease
MAGDAPTTDFPSPARLWAEQLALGLALFLGVLIFLAFFHTAMLSGGTQVLTTGHLTAYGWASLAGVGAQLILHEAGTIVAAWHRGVPVRFRFFPFGVNAAATLSAQPRRVWTDAVIGLAGPVTGAVVAGIFALVYTFTDDPFYLGMACVGCFYNLFTLIPILDLEGGWVAPAIAPQAWLAIVMAVLIELTLVFNLVLLGVWCFAAPRLFLLIRARVPREDLACTGRQRLIVALLYLALVLILAWAGTASFDALNRLIPEAMSD